MNVIRFFVFSAQLFFVSSILAHGVAIVDASTKEVLHLESSSTSVEVLNQVATFTTSQVFRNNSGSDQVIKYGFPLEESAAATALRWEIGGNWYAANFSPTPMDTSLPGTDTISSFPHPDLTDYLGESPLYFDLSQTIPADSSLTVELTYVRLLPYFSNTVDFSHPNDYGLIQTAPLQSLNLYLRVLSDRPIVSTDFLSHTATGGGWDADSIIVEYSASPGPANADYAFVYGLDPDVLGLFGFSTMLPDSLTPCDSLGPGFFAFIAEPEVDDAVTIDKVLTLVLDKSGSMSGLKWSQAQDGAKFVIDNLNPGDEFNIVVFNGEAESWMPDHVPATITNRNAAKSWIDANYSGGGTSIVAALNESMPDFSGYDPSESNVLIFMTDGQAEATSVVLAAAAANVATYGIPDLAIFTFAIGEGANLSLLSQLADNHNGEAVFLADADLYDVLTEFYSFIEFPVLLDTWLEFSAAESVSGILPEPLPNLYGGQQLLVVGRYDTPGPVNVSLKGLNYGDTITYSYDFELTSDVDPQMFFLTKLWAMEKIDQLMTLWYAAGPAGQEVIRQEITALSFCYSVISPFTSFTQNGGGSGNTSVGIEEEETEIGAQLPFVSPNPFQNQVQISFQHSGAAESVSLSIFDATGRLIALIEQFVPGPGEYHFQWDGTDLNGAAVNPGVYLFRISGADFQQLGSVVKG